jgi:DNA repair protein RecN (Recombination protein N)
VSAEFALDDAPAALAWLQERELAEDGACLVRRVLQSDGRTRAFVNGRPVPAGELRSLAEHLLEIFGQNESATLLRAEVQRGVLDHYGQYPEALEAVAEAAADHARLDAEIARLLGAQQRDPAQLDYLHFQLRELDALDLQEGELEALDAEHKRLANAGRLIEEGGAAQLLLYGGELSAYDQLAAALGLLRHLLPLNEGFGEAESLAGAAQAQTREAADALRRELERLELDPERLVQVEHRLGAVHDLARKHRVRAGELRARHAQLREEVSGLEHASERLAELERARARALQDYLKAAAALSRARAAASSHLAQDVSACVRPLGMPNAQFLVAVEPAARARPSAAGDDLVRFDFSANPGQPPRPLAKVASGGELSRLSLAIQVSLRAGGGPGTMIFDEVDAGIGGGVAEIVGRLLHRLGQQRQVLCVTHLAQVAAQGAQHYAIRKEIAGGTTYTRVAQLDGATRAEELARMLGGQEITAATQALAQDLLERASRRRSGAPLF